MVPASCASTGRSLRPSKTLPACDTPAAVTGAAEAGDPIAVETVALFAEHLGRIAGNLALTFLAHGGVYLAGGIAPRIVKVLQQGSFRAAFEDKYPHQALMASLPTAIIVHDRPALAGLVDFARRPKHLRPAPRRTALARLRTDGGLADATTK